MAYEIKFREQQEDWMREYRSGTVVGICELAMPAPCVEMWALAVQA